MDGMKMAEYKAMADEAAEEAAELLKMAKSKAPDGVYKEGTPAYENLIESYTVAGIATGLQFLATVPHMEMDDSGDHS